MKLSHLLIEQADLPENYPAHPDTVLLTNEFYPDGLTEYQVWRQLNNHVADLTRQLEGRRTLLVILTDAGKVIRRKDERGEFKIDSKPDVERLISGRSIEFHVVADRMSDMAWIDLDPKEEFPFAKVKKVAADLVPILNDVTDSDVEVKFSGSRGFHLISMLSKPRGVDELRAEIRDRVDDYVAGDDRMSTGVVRESDMMRIDVSTLHESGSIRAAWSFHADTGLLSIPVPLNEISEFEKADARINLPRKLDFVPFKEDPNSTSGQMRWRQRNPDDFISFATWKFWKGIHAPGLSFIAGPLKQPKGEHAVQAIRFDRSDWTASKASAWWEKNYLLFDRNWTEEDWKTI